MARQGVEPLTPEEAQEILSADPPGVLIGGMSLAFWAQQFGIEPPSALDAGITLDIDLLASRQEAKPFAERLQEALGDATVQLLLPTIEEHTPESAKVVISHFHERASPIEIDLIGSMHGFRTEDLKAVRRRAFDVDHQGARFKVMHPFDCLTSRIHNIDGLPGKRGRASVAQAKLAISVMGAFLARECARGKDVQRKTGLPLAEKLGRLAASAPAVRVWLKNRRIDPLECVPVDAFESANFREKRWPQVVAHVAGKRKAAERKAAIG